MRFKGKHSVSKQDLKEDRFQKFVEKVAEAYYRDRQKFWVGGAVALAAVVGVVLLVQGRGGGPNARAEVAFTQALGIYSSGDMVQAETALNQVKTRHGRDFVGAKARYYLGNVYYNTGRYAEAKTEFAAFLSRTRKDPLLSPAAQMGIANCEEQLGNNGLAAEAYEAAARRWPKSPLAFDASMAAARCYRNAGTYDRAQAVYERLLAGFKDKPMPQQSEEVKQQLAYVQALSKKFQ